MMRYKIHRVQLIHQNGETHYVTYRTDEIVDDIEKYRMSLIKDHHASKVNLTYSEHETSKN